jgi:hypothetical protein
MMRAKIRVNIREVFSLGLLCAAGLFLLAWITPKGLHVGTDSALYANSAQYLAAGKGWQLDVSTTYYQETAMLVEAAPLYPAVLAFATTLGASVLQGAWWANAAGVVLTLLGTYGLGRCLGGGWAGVIGVLMVLINVGFWSAASWMMTESLFIGFNTLALCTLCAYIASDIQATPRRWLLGAALLATLAVSTRFVGLVLAVPAFVAIALSYLAHRNRRQAVTDALLFLTPVLLAYGAWALRSYLLTDRSRDLGDWCAAGRCSPLPVASYVGMLWSALRRDLLPLPQLNLGIMSTVHRVAGASIVVVVLLIAGLGLLMVCLWLLYRYRSRAFAALRHDVPKQLVPVSYVLAYLAGILWMRWQSQVAYIPERYWVPVYPVVLASLVSLGVLLWRGLARWPVLRTGGLAVALTGVIVVGMGAVQALAALRGAAPSWAFDSPIWQENPMLASFDEEARADAVIFSNRCAAVYFVLGRPCRALPFRNQPSDDLGRFLALDYGRHPAYILWFPDTPLFWTTDDLLVLDTRSSAWSCEPGEHESILCRYKE